MVNILINGVTYPIDSASIGDGTITIQQGSTSQTFTTNQSADKTITLSEGGGGESNLKIWTFNGRIGDISPSNMIDDSEMVTWFDSGKAVAIYFTGPDVGSGYMVYLTSMQDSEYIGVTSSGDKLYKAYFVNDGRGHGIISGDLYQITTS